MTSITGVRHAPAVCLFAHREGVREQSRHCDEQKERLDGSRAAGKLRHDVVCHRPVLLVDQQCATAQNGVRAFTANERE